MRGLKRKVLGGESFFVTTYTAPAQGGFVDVAPYLFGDMLTLPVPNGHALILSRSGWVASGPGRRHRRQVGRLQEPVRRRGRLRRPRDRPGRRASSRCLGALDLFELGAGEKLILDSNHMVAYDETVTYNLRRAVEGRSIQSVKTGEGFVFEFTGPGRVYGQTRSPQSFLTWLKGSLTLSNESPTGAGGLMGGLGRMLDN